jgi:hypothetical protein
MPLPGFSLSKICPNALLVLPFGGYRRDYDGRRLVKFRDDGWHAGQ